jgi:glc operon protein GlcG
MRTSVGLALFLSALTLPAQNASAQLAEKKVLTLAAAQKMVAAAQAEAERNHLAGVIAVVDDWWPILLVRMDNAAYVASVELAPGKARTAALFKKPSEALEDSINQGRIAAVTARDFIEMKGGLPITIDRQVIGGIGASFDTPEHDEQIAKAGLAAFTRNECRPRRRVAGLWDNKRLSLPEPLSSQGESVRPTRKSMMLPQYTYCRQSLVA